jgi:hypothetical protein
MYFGVPPLKKAAGSRLFEKMVLKSTLPQNSRKYLQAKKKIAKGV